MLTAISLLFSDSLIYFFIMILLYMHYLIETMDFISTWKIYCIIVYKDLDGNCMQYAREMQMLSTLVPSHGANYRSSLLI